MSLGAAHLKVLDPEHGNQPMTAPGGTVLVFNGEVYNHRELRKELLDRGYRFHSDCDTETVLAAFLEWDTGAFARMRGMFSRHSGTSRAADSCWSATGWGFKPLNYTRRGRDLVFGSELKVLFAHPEVERQLDLAGLADYLSFNYVPGPRTSVQGIHKLPPGTWLAWEAGLVSSESYWRLRMWPDPFRHSKPRRRSWTAC